MKTFLGVVAFVICIAVSIFNPDRVDISAFASGFATACFLLAILEYGR